MNKGNRRFGALSSSENPEQLANRVKAVILASGTLIIWGVGHIFGITLTPTDIMSFATEISSVVAAIWFAYGVIKAAVIWALDWWHNRQVQ